MTKIIQLQEISKAEFFEYFEGVIDRKLEPLLMKDPNEKLSIQEVSEELGVSELTIHNYIKKGFIKAFRIGRRVFIKRLDLDASLKEVKSFKYKR